MEVEPRQQLDLFDEVERQLGRGRRALADFDLETARGQFAAFLARHPDSHDAQRGYALATRLLTRLAEIQAGEQDLVTALLALEPEIPDVCRKGWHRAVAREAERWSGSGCQVAGKPAGVHWMLGDSPEDARRSLEDSLQRQPRDVGARTCLADVLFRQGEVEPARRQYLTAFLIDPTAIDLDGLADPQVAVLPEIGREDYEVDGDGADWVPAVGTVEGVFSLPPPVIPGLADVVSLPVDTNFRGLAFYRCLVEERAAKSHNERVGKRRQMKELCPALFAAYLDHRVTAGARAPDRSP